MYYTNIFKGFIFTQCYFEKPLESWTALRFQHHKLKKPWASIPYTYIACSPSNPSNCSASWPIIHKSVPAHYHAHSIAKHNNKLIFSVQIVIRRLWWVITAESLICFTQSPAIAAFVIDEQHSLNFMSSWNLLEHKNVRIMALLNDSLIIFN